MEHVRARIPDVSLLALLLAVSGVALATGDDRANQVGHVHGIAQVGITADGSDVTVRLTAPAATLIGFERAPRTADERQTLRLAAENLKTGDALFRFNTEAGCWLAHVDVDADPGSTKKGGAAAGHSEMGASYRFSCDRPSALASAAVGLFVGFPALERVLVRYSTPAGRGGAELTPRNPVVLLVPLQ
jgi:hypothetical protein